MLTNVSETSLTAYQNQDNAKAREGQRKRVIDFILAETKAGRPTSRSAIAAHFYNIGYEPLAQKSSVARAVNEIIKLGTIIYGGDKYCFEQVAPRKFRPEDRTEIEHFCLVRVLAEAQQMSMFIY
jgi:hypothetical protein